MSATLRLRPPGASTSVWFQVYRTEDPGLGTYLMQWLVDSLKQVIPDGLENPDAGQDPDLTHDA